MIACDGRAAVSGATRHPLDDLDLLLRQPVQLINQAVDLSVSRRDLSLDCGLLVLRLRPCQLLVKRQHLLHEFDHPVVADFVGRVGEVDRADGEL